MPIRFRIGKEQQHMIATIQWLASDAVIFPLFQFLFFALIAYAMYKDVSRRRKGAKATAKSTDVARLSVTPTAENWNRYHITSAALSALLVLVIDSTNALQNYKTIISLADLTGLLYLTYFNLWFRNKIEAAFTKAQNQAA